MVNVRSKLRSFLIKFNQKEFEANNWYPIGEHIIYDLSQSIYDNRKQIGLFTKADIEKAKWEKARDLFE